MAGLSHDETLGLIVLLVAYVPLMVYLLALLVVVLRRFTVAHKRKQRGGSGGAVVTKAQVTMISLLAASFVARAVQFLVWIAFPPQTDGHGMFKDPSRGEYAALVLFWVFHYAAITTYLLGRVSLLSLFWDTLALLQRAVNLSHGVRGQVRSRSHRITAFAVFSCVIMVINIECIREAVSFGTDGKNKYNELMDIPYFVVYIVIGLCTLFTTLVFHRRSLRFFKRADSIGLRILRSQHSRRIALGIIFFASFVGEGLRENAWNEGRLKEVFYGKSPGWPRVRTFACGDVMQCLPRRRCSCVRAVRTLLPIGFHTRSSFRRALRHHAVVVASAVGASAVCAFGHGDYPDTGVPHPHATSPAQLTHDAVEKGAAGWSTAVDVTRGQPTAAPGVSWGRQGRIGEPAARGRGRRARRRRRFWELWCGR